MNFSVWFTVLVVFVTLGILPDAEAKAIGVDDDDNGDVEPSLDRLFLPKKQPQLLTRVMAELDGKGGKTAASKDSKEKKCSHSEMCTKIRKLKEDILALLDEVDCDENVIGLDEPVSKVDRKDDAPFHWSSDDDVAMQLPMEDFKWSSG